MHVGGYTQWLIKTAKNQTISDVEDNPNQIRDDKLPVQKKYFDKPNNYSGNKVAELYIQYHTIKRSPTKVVLFVV